eukprot:TRINITY_DN9399_c0_g1_i1.p1 TRINITY_DN9399_c0_g1~~TRINITY_DN9399_c0_g1_i1.p1  ORF type:complete len:1079 (+),score=270.25 TRINITY_DN9399_c0_g1_i1:282-3518(+)
MNREQKQCTGERNSRDTGKKKTSGLPIKTLIAEEMLKNADFNCRPPNIVARLMGLDELPKDSPANQKKEREKHVQAKQSWKQQAHPERREPLQRSLSMEGKLVHDPLLQRSHNLSLLPGSAFAAEVPQSKNSERNQRSGGKDESGNKRISKLRSDSAVAPRGNFKMCFPEENLLKHESTDDAKMALVRQKFLDAKRLASDESHLHSREFIEAVEFLQSNKDAFLKFLEEPNSLFSKESRPLFTHNQFKEITVLKSRSAKKTNKELKDDINGKGSSKMESHVKKPAGLKDHPARENRQDQKDTVKAIPEFPKSNQFKQCADIHANSFPTRIVVLKPNLGKARNIHTNLSQSLTQRSQTSANSSKAFEMPRRRNEDYLQEIRARLESELGKNRRGGTSCPMKFPQESYVNEPRYTRDGAKEIARQIRNAVTKEKSHEMSENQEASVSERLEKEYKDIYPDFCSPDTEFPETAGSGSCSSDTLGMFIDSSESVVNKEAKKRLLERWKSTHGSQGNLQLQREESSTLGEMLSFSLRKKEGKKLMRETENRNQKSLSQDGITGWERSSTSHSSRDHSDDSSLSRLQRSRSVPASASTYDEGVRAFARSRASVSDPTNAQIVLDDRASSSVSQQQTVKSKKEKSSFRGKVSSLKGSFLLRGKHTGGTKNNSEKPSSHTTDQRAPTQQRQNPVEHPKESSNYAPKATSEQDDFLGPLGSEALPPTKDASHSADAENASTIGCGKLLSRVNSTRLKNVLPSELMSQAFPSPCSPVRKLPLFEPVCSEKSNQKVEHSSPVSVLDTLYEEDLSSTKDFKEITTNLQDLQMRLNLLKLESHSSADLSHTNSLHQNGFESEADSMRANSCASSTDADWLQTPTSSLVSHAGNFDIEFLSIDTNICSEEQQRDLFYLKNVLRASGFTGDINHFFAKWHLPNSPLDPSLFERLEDEYMEIRGHDNWGIEFDATWETQLYKGRSERHLIFDCINEVLLHILLPVLNHRPWIKPAKLNLRIPSGKQLLQEIWGKLSCHLYPPPENCHVLQNIVADDLSREAVWMDLQDPMEAVAVDVERSIFSDLIEDILHELV